LAGRFEVAGYVRNLRDGRVELVTEGEPMALADFLDEIRREMRPYIMDETIESLPQDSDPFAGFSIRY
jgi:acylphosphatase